MNSPFFCKYLDRERKEGNLMEVHKRDPKPKARKMKTEDRRILEKVILPHFSQEKSCQRILFVGCASYTMWYDKFFEKKEYWTLEPQKERRCYGAKRHITDNVLNAAQHFNNKTFQKNFETGAFKSEG